MSQSALLELVEVMARLRRECAWKAGQTHESLARYLLEETYEVLEAIDAGDAREHCEELGDLLFAVVNLARHLNIEPEAALREANRKFEQRFRAIEQAPGFADMSLEEMEALWVEAKKAQAALSD